jgi:predicted kinase
LVLDGVDVKEEGMASSLLIAFAGLPGTGKTTLARALMQRLVATYLRIDTIEQALRDSGVLTGAMEDAGYRVAYALAAEALGLGQVVIADSVNPIAVTREAWRRVAMAAASPILEVEVICSDRAEHRRRVETRTTDIAGLVLPTWRQVVERDYQTWDRPPLRIDTAGCSVDDATAVLSAAIAEMLPLPPAGW